MPSVTHDRTLGEIWPPGEPPAPTEFSDSVLVLVAGALLGGYAPDATLVDGGTPPRPMGGYSILTKMLEKGNPYGFLLFRNVGSLLGGSQIPLTSGDSLGTLLERFHETKFGHSVVVFARGPVILGLSNLIDLYQSGRLETSLTCQEVASPILPGIARTSTVEEAAAAMVKNRVRRLLIEGDENSMITDRTLINLLFSRESLDWILDHGGAVPPVQVSQLSPVRLVEVKGGTRIPEAARRFDPRGGEALRCSGGIVTPWDLVMKPFGTDRLSLVHR